MDCTGGGGIFGGACDRGGGGRVGGTCAVPEVGGAWVAPARSTVTDLSSPVTAMSYEGGRLGSLGRLLSAGLMMMVRWN